MALVDQMPGDHARPRRVSQALAVDAVKDSHWNLSPRVPCPARARGQSILDTARAARGAVGWAEHDRRPARARRIVSVCPGHGAPAEGRHAGAQRTPTLDANFMARLAQRPVWLAGVVIELVGFGMQAVALGLGRLVVVQPIQVVSVVFALPLGARLTGQRAGRREIVGAVAGHRRPGGVPRGDQPLGRQQRRADPQVADRRRHRGWASAWRCF